MYAIINLCRKYFQIIRFYYVHFGQINESVCLYVCLYINLVYIIEVSFEYFHKHAYPQTFTEICQSISRPRNKIKRCR